MDSETKRIKAKLDEAENNFSSAMRVFDGLKHELIHSESLSYWPAVELKRKYEKAWKEVKKFERQIIKNKKKLM